MTRAERIILTAAAAGVLVIMTSYAAVRLVTRTAETLAALDTPEGIRLDGFPWAPVLVGASLLLLRAAFKAGQYHRGFMHARGIWQSHRSAIGGGHK